MPKIIENLETKLMQEARHQIETSGYSAMTIRSVASACGVGVGTVYNYFRSKEDLLARYMLRDWQQCLEEIHRVSDSVASLQGEEITSPGGDAGSLQRDSIPQRMVRCIYEQLCRYADSNRALFQDPAAASAFAASFGRYHGILRSQLAQPLRSLCDSEFAAEFIAESLLTWTMAGRSFDEIYGIIGRLFCE